MRYQLLELAATFSVLIGDANGFLRRPSSTTCLLLGLKGTFSEIEHFQITARVQYI